jgi:hypothetical protein
VQLQVYQHSHVMAWCLINQAQGQLYRHLVSIQVNYNSWCPSGLQAVSYRRGQVLRKTAPHIPEIGSSNLDTGIDYHDRDFRRLPPFTSTYRATRCWMITFPNCTFIYSQCSIGMGSNPGKAKTVLFSTMYEAHLAFYQWAPRCCIKRPEREADYRPPSSPEINNGGAIPPLLYMSSWHST